MVEAVHVATAHGFTTDKQGAGGQAIMYLIDQGLLPERGTAGTSCLA
ncbi:hypothetical protein [Streptomyces siamensis]|uniref:Uncharacterized protein n=1 Tax=Streptomyces siamensis TaxID=1274986 RepID=A0ABP9JDF2_9ACTN